jgi:hypothetical protein
MAEARWEVQELQHGCDRQRPGTLTRHGWLRYDRRLSICSGKDNKDESAATIAEPPFEQFTYLGSQHENFFR